MAGAVQLMAAAQVGPAFLAARRQLVGARQGAGGVEIAVGFLGRGDGLSSGSIGVTLGPGELVA